MFYKKRIEKLEADKIAMQSNVVSLLNRAQALENFIIEQNRINFSLSEQVGNLTKSMEFILNNPPKYRKNQAVGSYTIINVNLHQNSEFYSYSLKHNKNDDILNYVPETSIKNLK